MLTISLAMQYGAAWNSDAISVAMDSNQISSFERIITFFLFSFCCFDTSAQAHNLYDYMYREFNCPLQAFNLGTDSC